MKKIIIVWFALFNLSSFAQTGSPDMKSMFNGKNLDGWYTFLTSKGKGNDPEKVFLVENGMLHISGKEFGYISTEKEYTDFHMAVEFKWGVKKYPPRDADSIKRDNGICYYIPGDAKDTVWPVSIECQIQEGDVGDIWLIGHPTIVADGKQLIPDNYYYRSEKKRDAEKPTGVWNRVEVISNKGKITYIVNGTVVNEAENPSITKGKIIIQSEGAEIFYRKIEIAEL